MARGHNTSMDALRLDKWLWAARFFRTGSQAKAAVERGHVRLNGARTKPAKELKTHDTLTIRREYQELAVRVTALTDRRGNAQAAGSLYAETPSSVQRRDAQIAQRQTEVARHGAPTTRPTKAPHNTKAPGFVLRLSDGGRVIDLAWLGCLRDDSFR